MTISIEIAYALPEKQMLLSLIIPKQSTAHEAIIASEILKQCPELMHASLTIGIFGKKCALDAPLRQGDRIEIYRPLIHDPKQARRQRALK